MTGDDSMDLICYKYEGWQPRIRPGSPKRVWMDDTNERYAYRCLPLTIANSHGWELLSPMAFEAIWDGGIHMDSIQIRMDPGFPDHLKPVSLFGYGTITWHVEGIFRTPPGWNLWVSGPPNRQKDAIQPLGGIIETDWSPYTFTMNWRFTRPNQWIRFEENEPIAFFFPVERGRVEKFRPRIVPLEKAPELRAAFEKWSASRNAFQKWVQETNPPAPSDKWQKLYFRGLDPDGAACPFDHQSKLRLPPFTFPDGSAMEPPEATSSPIRSRHQVLPGPDIFPVEHAAQPANLLANPAAGGMANAAAGGAANPALALALNRIGFQPQQAKVQFQVPARPDRTADLALKRRNWILDVQAKQRRLSSRTGGVERVSQLSGQDFLDFYYALSRPVVICGALRDWPAVERWTPDYLAEAVGGAEIEFQGDRNSSPDFELYPDRHKRQMPFNRFISQIRDTGFGNDAYITAHNEASNRAAFAPLEADLEQLPEYLAPGPGAMWIGPGGTFTPLHFELANLLAAQVVGSKRFVLLPPSETQRLYNNRHTLSAVRDITDEDQLAEYPLAARAETFEVDLEAGDLLFVPIGWWQQETALDFSVTLTYTNFRWPNGGAATFPED
jgi:hypothetical protein